MSTENAAQLPIEPKKRGKGRPPGERETPEVIKRIDPNKRMNVNFMTSQARRMEMYILARECGLDTGQLIEKAFDHYKAFIESGETH